MPRQARLVFEGMPHHVTQRGNYRQAVFESQQDFQYYSYRMEEYAKKYHVVIIAYCLMSNHVHFIVEPHTRKSLASLFNTVHMRYSQYKNRQKNKVGHLWQGRFFSCVLDAEHLLRAVRYVEQNPVRARITHAAGDYVWSSARFHLGLEKNPIIKTIGCERIMKLWGGRDWRGYLREDDPSMVDLMREKTQKGHVVATEENISFLEEKFGIILRKKKAGRPGKEK